MLKSLACGAMLSFFIAVFSFSSFAQSVDYVVRPVAQEVAQGGIALFDVAITNTGDFREEFRLHGDPFESGLFSSFYQYVTTTPDTFLLDPGESTAVRVSIQLSDKAPLEQSFTVTLLLDTLSRVSPGREIIVEPYVLPKGRVVYLFLKDSGDILPGKNYTMNVVVSNRQDTQLQRAQLKVSGDLFGIGQSKIVDVPAAGEITVPFTFAVAPFVKPGAYMFRVEAVVYGKLKGSAETVLSVPRVPAVEGEDASQQKFLKIHTFLERENRGNAPAQERLEYRASTIERLFLTLSPEPTSQEGNIYAWDFTLEPGASYSVDIEKNFRPLFYGFFIIVAVFFGLVMHIHLSVTLRKRLYVTQGDKLGVYDVRTLLIVRNGKRRPITHVRLMDILPNVLHPTYGFTTLKPTTIQRGTYGQRFVWDLEKLQPKEERVFSYTVRVRLYDVGGNAILPAAALHYNDRGSAQHIKSDRILVGMKS